MCYRKFGILNKILTRKITEWAYNHLRDKDDFDDTNFYFLNRAKKSLINEVLLFLKEILPQIHIYGNR